MGLLSILYHRRRRKQLQVESLDFEAPGNQKFHPDAHGRNWGGRARQDLINYSTAAVIALLVGLIYTAVYYSVHYVFVWRASIFIKQLNARNLGLAWLYATVTSLMFSIPGALLCMYEPSAAGSGMPEVISFLNGIKIRKFFSVRTLIFKLMALVCVVASGLFSGYDGPMAHVGLIVSVIILRWVKSNPTVKRAYFGQSKTAAVAPDLDMLNLMELSYKRQTLLTAATGAAAGLSAAFHAPLGGVMFALEEAISFFEPFLIIRTLFMCLITYVVVGVVTKTQIIGPQFLVSKYALFPVDSACESLIAYQDLFSFLFMGVAAGLLGVLYNRLVVWVVRIRQRLLGDRPYWRLFEVAAVTLITMTVVVMLPSGFNQCTPYRQALQHLQYQQRSCEINCEEIRRDFFLKKHPYCYSAACFPSSLQVEYDREIDVAFEQATRICPVQSNFTSPLISVNQLIDRFDPPEHLIVDSEARCYYQWSSLMFTMPLDVLSNLFSRGVFDLFNAEVLATFAVVYLILSLAVYDLMLPTDMVTPNLIFGATLGRLYGLFVNYLKLRIGASPVDPGAYALIGAAAFWSGTARITVTIAVIAIESTFDLTYLPGLILALCMATMVGNWFSGSLYHMEIRCKHMPFLGQVPPPELLAKQVCEIMSTDLVTLPERISAAELYHRLEETGHQGFAITAPFAIGGREGERLAGFVLRSQLKRKILDSVATVTPAEVQVLSGASDSCASTIDRRPGTGAFINNQTAVESGDPNDSIEMNDLEDTAITGKTTINKRLSQKYVATIASPLRSPPVSDQTSLPVCDASIDHTPPSRGGMAATGDDLKPRRHSQTNLLNRFGSMISLDHDDTVLDLTRIMSAPPHTVHLNMNAGKAFEMFRHLRLRHLCVVDDNHRLVGMLTRRSFIGNTDHWIHDF